MTTPKGMADRDLIEEVVSRCQLGAQFLIEMERALEAADVPIGTEGELSLLELD